MVTLLMVLFIVMFAMSEVDEKKFNALKEGLAAGFGDSTAILDGSDNLLEQAGVSDVDLIEANEYVRKMPPEEQAKFKRGARARGAAQARSAQYADGARPRWTGSRSCSTKLDARAARARACATTSRPASTSAAWCSAWSRKHVVFEPDLAELSARGIAGARHHRAGAARGSTTRCGSTGTPTRCR